MLAFGSFILEERPYFVAFKSRSKPIGVNNEIGFLKCVNGGLVEAVRSECFLRTFSWQQIVLWHGMEGTGRYFGIQSSIPTVFGMPNDL